MSCMYIRLRSSLQKGVDHDDIILHYMYTVVVGWLTCIVALFRKEAFTT